MSGKHHNNLLLISAEFLLYGGMLVWLLWYFLPQALQ